MLCCCNCCSDINTVLPLHDWWMPVLIWYVRFLFDWMIVYCSFMIIIIMYTLCCFCGMFYDSCVFALDWFLFWPCAFLFQLLFCCVVLHSSCCVSQVVYSACVLLSNFLAIFIYYANWQSGKLTALSSTAYLSFGVYSVVVTCVYTWITLAVTLVA